MGMFRTGARERFASAIRGIGLACAIAALFVAGPGAVLAQRPPLIEPGATVQQAQGGPTRKRREKAEEARKLREGEARRKAEDARKRRAGAFRDCPQCPEMVTIPGGTFRMGSNSGYEEEKPVHRVTVGRFAMGKYEVTFAEWDACVVAGGCGWRPKDRGWGRGRRPVIDVSWDDAKKYIVWLSRKTGKRYRLPSESEWEYAARAGTRTKYWWGDAIGRNNANCNGCGSRSRWDDKKTFPVGSFRPNGFGLYDVHGNVREWVEDCWNDSYAGAPSDGRPWTSGNCIERVSRDSSWLDPPRLLRSANRFRVDPRSRGWVRGFRVARTLP